MKITIRHCDDWVAVYKDGQKVEENHSVPLEFGLRALGIEFESVEMPVDDLGNLIGAPKVDPFPESIE